MARSFDYSAPAELFAPKGRPGMRQPGAPLSAAGLELDHALDAAEQGLIDGLEHARIANGGDQQCALVLDLEQLARRGVGEQEAAASQVVVSLR